MKSITLPYATPYILTDLAVFQAQCRLFKQHLAGVKLFYAYKAMSHPRIVAAIDQHIEGYDIASVNEARELLALGVNPGRLIYSNPVKSEQSIREAYVLGVRTFAFQSAQEIAKLQRQAPKSLLFLRVAVTDGKDSLAFSSKFGCAPDEAPELLAAAAQSGFTELGLTFHVGSQSSDLDAWHNALRTCREIADTAARLDVSIQSINLGGGFPVRYNASVPPFAAVVIHIKQALADYGFENISLYAEPGRFLSADASVVVASIIGKEQRSGKDWLYLDVGAFQAFIEIFEFDSFPYPVWSLRHGKDTDAPQKSYTLTGPSCDAYDTLAHDIRLPHDLEVGDKLVFEQCGAYTTVYGSNFNGFDVPAHYFLEPSPQSPASRRVARELVID